LVKSSNGAVPAGIADLLALPENSICPDCQQKQAK
jgi:hypothetical protein